MWRLIKWLFLALVVLGALVVALLFSKDAVARAAVEQQFRAQTRDPQWQAHFLAQPLAARLAFAEQARAASRARYGELQASGQSETITDVTPATVQDWFARFGVTCMIHGHTHRPAIHDEGNGHTRIVLGDWYTQGSVLRVDADGAVLAAL